MLKVLVVEDEPYVRRGIVLSVDWTALDCFVVGEAANGEEGYDAALKFQPNIIITDIRMPKMDGIEMLKRLREAGCKSEVIILTAYSDFEYAQNALHYGAADYLLKPFHDGELEQVIVSIHSRLMARQGNAAESLPALQLKKGDKSKYVMESLAYIAGHYNDPDIGVGSIAANAGISEGYLCHIFKKETNYTLMEYLSQYRMHVAMQLLRDCRVKIYEVAEQVGYAPFQGVPAMGGDRVSGLCIPQRGGNVQTAEQVFISFLNNADTAKLCVVEDFQFVFHVVCPFCCYSAFLSRGFVVMML